jgi:hypothetical protein
MKTLPLLIILSASAPLLLTEPASAQSGGFGTWYCQHLIPGDFRSPVTCQSGDLPGVVITEEEHDNSPGHKEKCKIMRVIAHLKGGHDQVQFGKADGLARSTSSISTNGAGSERGGLGSAVSEAVGAVLNR